MTLLCINASIRGQDSISRTLSQKLANRFVEAGHNLIDRDLTQEITFVSGQSFEAERTPKEARTSEQNAHANLADCLIEELKQADIIVIGAPVYNFGPPASLKAWADLVARAGTTFKYSETGPKGLLKDKKAYIIAVSGGTPIGSDFDFMSSWLKFFLGFLGISDVEIITADGIYGQDGEEKIKKAHKVIDNMVI